MNLSELMAQLHARRIAKIERRADQLRKQLAPVLFTVSLKPDTARHLLAYALEEGVSPETVIRESVRSYLGNV